MMTMMMFFIHFDGLRFGARQNVPVVSFQALMRQPVNQMVTMGTHRFHQQWEIHIEPLKFEGNSLTIYGEIAGDLWFYGSPHSEIIGILQR